ncbi:MAG: hypothetical protein P4L41_16255 [Flavipsychrobacter sp.]|nr:hypothetical protein [Flavipsychrobacter sp.]
MNWKLIFGLSLLGLVMAIGTVFFIPASFDYVLWPVVFIISAYQIGKKATKSFFAHGFMLGLANCVWVTTAHVVFAPTYLLHHPQEAEMGLRMGNVDPQEALLLLGPVVGVISGVVIGILAAVAGAVIRSKNQQPV